MSTFALTSTLKLTSALIGLLRVVLSTTSSSTCRRRRPTSSSVILPEFTAATQQPGQAPPAAEDGGKLRKRLAEGFGRGLGDGAAPHRVGGLGHDAELQLQQPSQRLAKANIYYPRGRQGKDGGNNNPVHKIYNIQLISFYIVGCGL